MSISRVFNPRNCDNGIEFEAYVVDYLNKFGLNARRTKGDDGGVDVIATYSHNNVDYNFYIQCKFQNRMQGKEPIQEIYAGMHFRNDKNGYPVVITNNNFSIESQKYARACLKIHSRHLHAPLCGIFGPNSLNVAHYAAFIWAKSPTKCDAQLPESNFQTRSRKLGVELIGKGKIGLIRYANSCGSVFTYNIGFLLSIILYEITNDEKLKENLRFKDLPCEDSKKSERETLREQIINEFETAKDMVLEYELLQMKASAKLKEALEAKKNAIIHGIEYG